MPMTRRAGILLGVLALALARCWAVPVHLLATGDMHGWLEPQQADGRILGGPAQMLAYWREVEGYAPDKFLLVSCGDVATGPALSTVFKGEPVIAVMNAMGYDLSVIGNHEFDFGAPALQKMETLARFPFLAANLVNPEGGPTPLAAPTLLYTEQGVKVGIIGLTVLDLNKVASTGGWQTRSYADTVRARARELRQSGAQVLVVVAHVEAAELVKLAEAVRDLHIPLMLGGHSHEMAQQKVGDTWVVNSGQWWDCYSRIDLDVNPDSGRTAVLACKLVWLQQDSRQARVDRTVSELVAGWRARLPADDLKPLGYTVTGLRRPWGVANFILDRWLAAFPADLAVSNLGGFRQDLQPGAICRLDLLGVMPFDNGLLRLKLTGAQFAAYNPGRESLAFAGVRKEGGRYIILKTGAPLDPAAGYRVLINTFLYTSSRELKAADPNPELVDPDWRASVLRWLAEHPTTLERPLETLVDAQPRSD